MSIQNVFRPVWIFCAAALLASVTVPAALAAQQPYHILDRWKIGGEGGWDYLLADSAAHRLYLAHGPRVDVVDTTTGKLIGSITGLYGTHGIALDNHGKFGYISDGGGNAVIVFDRATLTTVASIPAGTNPDGIVFEPATQTVWAFNGRSHNVTVIDTATRKVAATIDLPGKPEFPVADGQGSVFDNIEDKSEIVRFDAHSKTITATWPAGCDSPSGLAFDVPGHRLFPVCDGKKMSVIDSRDGKLLANPAIGDGPDAAGWSAKHHLAFASSGDGVLSVIDANASGYPTIESLPTQRGARTMAYDAGTDRVYTVTAEFGPRPDPTPQNPRSRPAIVPGSFTIIVIGR
ncbi:MAG TPA: YncE family protein [Terracidiphilus sp.]|nr:YncE family protein [Terracidiphilus sp.]